MPKIGWLPAAGNRPTAHLNRRPDEASSTSTCHWWSTACARSAPRTASSRRPSRSAASPLVGYPRRPARHTGRYAHERSYAPPPPRAGSSPTSTRASAARPSSSSSSEVATTLGSVDSAKRALYSRRGPSTVGVLVVLAFLALLLLGRGGRLGLHQFGLLSQNLDSLVCFSSVTCPWRRRRSWSLSNVNESPRRRAAGTRGARRPPRDTREPGTESRQTPSLRKRGRAGRSTSHWDIATRFPRSSPNNGQSSAAKAANKLSGSLSSFETLISKIWPPTFNGRSAGVASR